MERPPSPANRYGSPAGGIRQSDVSHAADTLLRAGDRPTVEKVRTKLGRGSPNTINPMLDAWWKTLSARLDAGPAARTPPKPKRKKKLLRAVPRRNSAKPKTLNGPAVRRKKAKRG